MALGDKERMDVFVVLNDGLVCLDDYLKAKKIGFGLCKLGSVESCFEVKWQVFSTKQVHIIYFFYTKIKIYLTRE